MGKGSLIFVTSVMAGAIIIILVLIKYGTAQFKLNRIRMQHGLNTICFLFYMHASMHVYARLMTSNLSFKALVYTLDVCMTVWRHTCACQEGARQA